MLQSQLYKPILLSLLFFAIAALLGISMRAAFVMELPNWFDYRNVQHGHSHVALLGWLFGAFYLGIVHFFNLGIKKFLRLYWLLQATVFGMLITFPFTGYDFLSIVFTSLHIILSYAFIFKAWKALKVQSNQGISSQFLKTSLVFLFLSTIGTWALGPIMSIGLKGTAWYYGSIQFYLHFQFNGWFIFALLAMLFKIIESKGVLFDQRIAKWFYRLITFSTILTFALAVTWSTPNFMIFLINSLGVLVQLVALMMLLYLIRPIKPQLRSILPKYVYQVFSIAMIAFILKILIQFAVVIPYLAEVSYTIRNFVIGFIHLLMLGCLSLFVFGIVNYMTKLEISKSGTFIFILGVIFTEILLFVQGLMLWQGWGFLPSYYLILLLGSCFIFVGLFLIISKFILAYKK